MQRGILHAIPAEVSARSDGLNGIFVLLYREGAVALSPTKKTNRSLPKGIERFAAFVYNKIAKHHQQESEDIIPQ